jgi:hypothetical protein
VREQIETRIRSMARLFLADSQRRALTRLGQIDEGQAAKLVATFERLRSYLTVDALGREAVQAAPSLDPVDEVVVTLLGLATEARHLDAGEIAQLLRESLDGDMADDVHVDLERMVDVAARLTSTRALRTSANAHEVLAQHDRNFQAARIFTDLRPLFDASPDQPPSGAVIVEMLQLETWSGDGRTETVRVALDRADLLELRAVIDRAIQKTDSLRRLMEDSGVATFELEDHRT